MDNEKKYDADSFLLKKIIMKSYSTVQSRL